MQINIIDPSSTEFNRGSFCYAPYLLYNGLTHYGDRVNLIESFLPENLDTIPKADAHIISLWSYPQVECAILLAKMLPYQFGEDYVYFVGYSPMIEYYGLRHVKEWLGFDPLQDADFLTKAMILYPDNYKNFKRLLLSDCDMHLQHLEKGEKVHPLFTSYGCPNGCAFCPSTKNCGRTRIEVPLPHVKAMLNSCLEKGIRSIHFTDEDFFFDIDRAYEILKSIQDSGYHLIALGSAKAVFDFIKKYGTEVLLYSGLEIIEIGFESGSENVSKSMGSGKSLTDCQRLAEIQNELPCRIFWLVQTFFPGENIHSLNETGKFMRQYGFNMEDVVGRLRTNGTKGGLGQFFQPYHGTAIHHSLSNKGIFLTERPVRLIPSYLPNTFLEDTITEVLPHNYEAALQWLTLYNVHTVLPPPDKGMIGKRIGDYIYNKNMYTQIQMALALAIYARFDIIR